MSTQTATLFCKQDIRRTPIRGADLAASAQGRKQGTNVSTANPRLVERVAYLLWRRTGGSPAEAERAAGEILSAPRHRLESQSDAVEIVRAVRAQYAPSPAATSGPEWDVFCRMMSLSRGETASLTTALAPRTADSRFSRKAK